MKMIVKTAMVAGLLALGACNNTPAGNAADNVGDSVDNTVVVDDSANAVDVNAVDANAVDANAVDANAAGAADANASGNAQ